MFCWGGNCVKYFFNSHETSMTVFFFFFFFFLGGGPGVGGWGWGSIRSFFINLSVTLD